MDTSQRISRVRRLAEVGAILAGVLASASGCGPTSFLITPVSADRSLIEHVLLRESPFAGDKILLLDLNGVISNAVGGTLLGMPAANPVVSFKEKLDKAGRDSRVKAVVLRVNSPGGGVTASDLMYTELRRFREKHGKPVIASFLDTAASGGYYVACAADRIFAHPTTVTGSIGVLMVAPDVSGTMARIGLRTNVIKSGPMKDAGSPLREMSETDRAVFQGMIDAMHERFLSVVQAGRPGIDPGKLRELADGRVYLGPQAKELGLVDEIGTLDDAVAAAKSAGDIAGKPIVLVSYAPAAAYRPNAYAQPPVDGPSVSVIQLELPEWLRGGGPQFMYLWAPQW